MSQDFNLAKVFSDLANDPSWPWYVVRIQTESPLIMALMVVDEIATNLEQHDEIEALELEDINPDHYAKVKKRVEEIE